MKNILLIVLCLGFAMTQSIQTKQVEVTINDWSELEQTGEMFNGQYVYTFDMSDYIALYEGAYILTTPMVEWVNNNQEDYWNLLLWGCFGHTSNQDTYWNWNYDDSGSISVREQGIRLIPDSCTDIFMKNYDNNNHPVTITFWVTGMFEDEGVGLQGDMNDDEIINVIDIIALVNIIIDVEE